MSDTLCITLNPTIDISCEANRVQPTLKVRTFEQTYDPGGGGTNVARVISTLGGVPKLVVLCGGQTGQWFQSLLQPYGLDLQPFEIKGEVRISYTVHEADTHFEYRFVPEGPTITIDELSPVFDLLDRFDGNYVVASGSLPDGAPDDTYAEMAKIAQGKGQRFVLDTSGNALQNALNTASVFLVKPSLRELETFAGHALDDQSVRDVCRELVAQHRAKNIVVSMGREGAMLCDENGCHRVPALIVKAVSAVGAGDSFVGGMVWALSNGRETFDAFHFGMAAATATVLTPGTRLCNSDDIWRLYGQLKAE